jgi:hypothetical protein
MVDELEYADTIRLLSAKEPDLASEFGSFLGIESVLRWMAQRGLTQTKVDIVGQDEFHYDFLILLKTGQWLAFGVN